MKYVMTMVHEPGDDHIDGPRIVVFGIGHADIQAIIDAKLFLKGHSTNFISMNRYATVVELYEIDHDKDTNNELYDLLYDDYIIADEFPVTDDRLIPIDDSCCRLDFAYMKIWRPNLDSEDIGFTFTVFFKHDPDTWESYAEVKLSEVQK